MIKIIEPTYTMEMTHGEAIALFKLVCAVTSSDCNSFGLIDSQEEVIQSIFTALERYVGGDSAEDRQK